MRLTDDRRLASLAAGGDERAFGLLVERHEARLLSVSRAVLRSDDDAHDAVQNALLKAFRALQAGQLRGEPRPWLARIAHNEARSLARVRRDFTPLEDDSLGAAGDPHDVLASKEHWSTVVADVAALPERLRRPLLLRAEAGLPYAAIAGELGVSESAARQAVSDARAVLAADAAAREDDCAEIRSILRSGDRRHHRSRRVRGHLRTCAPCRAWRPQRRKLLLAPLGLLASAAEWLGAFVTAGGGGGAAAALRSTTVVAAVASGSIAFTADTPSTRDTRTRTVKHQASGATASTRVTTSAPTRVASPAPTMPVAGTAQPVAIDSASSGDRSGARRRDPGPARADRDAARDLPDASSRGGDRGRTAGAGGGPAPTLAYRTGGGAQTGGTTRPDRAPSGVDARSAQGGGSSGGASPAAGRGPARAGGESTSQGATTPAGDSTTPPSGATTSPAGDSPAPASPSGGATSDAPSPPGGDAPPEA